MIRIRKPGFSLQTLLFLAVIALSTRPVQTLAQFESDARWAPPQTNFLVLINSERIFDSELARKEKAADASRAAFETGTSIVTPNVDRIMIASRIDLEVAHTLWTSAVYSRAKKPFDLNEIANRVGAAVDPIAGRDTVHLPNDAMLVALAPMTAGAMKPGSRQAVAGWLKASSASGSNQLPGYLKNALSTADKDVDITMAMDLEDALSPAEIRRRVATMSSVKQDEVESVSAALETIKGITLRVTIRKAISGSITIDFQSGASVLEKTGKPLLLEILQNRGMMIDDIEGWTLKATATQLTLTGDLSLAGLRAISSLVSQPMMPEITADSTDDSAAPHARSKTYFNSLETYVSELSAKRPSTFGMKSYAVLFENYARKIDEFSILGVDPELVALGDSVSNRLREMSHAAQQGFLNSKKRRSEVQNEAHYGGYYGGYYDGYNNGGYNRYYNRTSRKKMIETEERKTAEEQIRASLLEVKTEMNTVRQNMSLKYSVDF
jgi:hypothetical protein